MQRISKDEYYLNIAREVSKRSTCLRRQYGCVIVKDDTIVSTGYNGSARGELNCSDAGYCERQALQVKPGERYELCRAVHAETNACLHAGRERTIGATLYLYGQDTETGLPVNAKPCLMCSRIIRNSGITRVVCGKEVP